VELHTFYNTVACTCEWMPKEDKLGAAA